MWSKCSSTTPISTLLEGSSNCNNTYVTNNNYPAADSAQPSVLPSNQSLYPQLSLGITTTSPMYSYPKVRKPAPPPPPIPPSYNEVVHDVSIESDEKNQLLGEIVYHHD
ncbi:hypothetical protein [Candidatus Tisiphia endosymbiont of Empis tessellata]|uniref:hypothetical protein n=1 Tax=Candidatus Tisiphia endosymbiont of Empis tessellata TaxID=3066259 RepID=UPI00313CDD03